MAEQSDRGAQSNMAGRDKYWEELSEGEKIEQMRLEFKRVMSSIKSLREILHNMKAHKHLGEQIVVPLDFYNGGESERSSRAEKYF